MRMVQADANVGENMTRSKVTDNPARQNRGGFGVTNAPSLGERATMRAFTLVELIVVIGVIVLLIAILLPALRIAKANSEWAASQNNLRQVATLMQGYTSDNRDRILPSQFDHRPPIQFKGAMRSMMPATPGGPPLEPPPIGALLVGTWADILWTTANLGTFSMPQLSNGDPVLDAGGEYTPGVYTYRYDSPDRSVYTVHPGYTKNILRSTIGMTRPFSEDSIGEALPWGTGASRREIDHPGYFAANNFFNSAPWLGVGGGVPLPGQLPQYYPSSQVKFPAAAVYLVDSRAGETINPLPDPWRGTPLLAGGIDLCEVDFRYPGESCLVLCLDGHIQTEAKWDRIEDVQGPYYSDPAGRPSPGANDAEPRGLKISNLNRSDNPGP